MRLGIDLGTTSTVVAVADRGNYPVLGFSTADGDLSEYFPSITAEVDGRLVHGHEAEAAARSGAPQLRSWKRLLGELRTDDELAIGAVRTTPLELATRFLEALRFAILEGSNLRPKKRRDGGQLEAAISVPANACSTQRFLTLEAFRRAGFEVRAVINEPSAAGLEYAHRHPGTIGGRREHVAIYDLGGGTFDAALVLIAGGRHDVIATGGVARLGGDDFDLALLELVLERAGITEISAAERAGLLLECRLGKEALNPSSRRVVVDLAPLAAGAPSETVVIPIAEYHARVSGLVERSIEALAPVLEAGSETEATAQATLAGIYLVGGASGLPLVPRLLRERFGRLVHRSPHPSAATAIGLAIAAGAEDSPMVAERFTRHLGVFREADAGHAIAFDGIFEKGTPMPIDAPLVAVRRYRAAHNLGHFRFVECGALDGAGTPSGDITPHADLRFPFDSALRGRDDLTGVPVVRLPDGPLIEERYELDPAGVLLVTITNLDAGYGTSYRL